jgi:hypothetical protein
MEKPVLEPGLPGDDQNMRNSSDAGECGVGHFELFVELFCLLGRQARKTFLFGHGLLASIRHCRLCRLRCRAGLPVRVFAAALYLPGGYRGAVQLPMLLQHVSLYADVLICQPKFTKKSSLSLAIDFV